MNEKIRKDTQFYLINLPILIYALGCIMDTSHFGKKYINFVEDHIVSKNTGLFVTYGIIWLVAIIIVLVEIRWESGIILGLRKIDVLEIMIGKKNLMTIKIVFSAKILIYTIAYIFIWKWTLFLGIWEIMISLIYILFRIFKIINTKKVAEMLYDNTEKSIQESCALEGGNSNLWIIIKAAERLNYRDMEECAELIRNMSGIVNVIKVEENIIKKDEAAAIVRLMKKTALLTKAMYVAADDRKRMRYIICECYDQIHDADEMEIKKYLLIRNLLCDLSYAFTPGDIIRMLKSLSRHYEQCLRYLIVYIKCFSDCVGEQPWHIAYMKALVAEYKSVCANDKKANWKNCLNVLYIELMYSESNVIQVIDMNNNNALEVSLHKICKLVGVVR